ncbi:MAG: tRNA (adenosine(37)-N6)-threonylcarbamoyltransferase complex ATPase subunit type 1 TsaE [Planctomyces sp.]|nr:tRNA (adenosine(37)-N6)-threonylcarbamoyltransferase complex ATPase subunit type 1 TsaE [Planctomyces sp.]
MKDSYGGHHIRTVDCEDEAATDCLGRCLADIVEGGLVITLDGELGSGKTRLVRSLCDSLGVGPNQVNSPTFVILQFYTDGRVPIAHFDTYRLADVDEFLAIGADEYLNSTEWLCLVEWANRVEEILPEDRLRIRITQTGVGSRRFEFEAGGDRSELVLKKLRTESI